MASNIERKLLCDAVNAHGRKPEGTHTEECCSQAREMAKVILGMGGTVQEALPKSKPVRMATPKMVEYVATLLGQRDVATYWAGEAREFLDDAEKQTFRQAGRLIDIMKVLPFKAKREFLSDRERPATPKMAAWAQTLVAEKVGGEDYLDWDLEHLTYAQASQIIDALKDAPKAGKKGEDAKHYPAGPGFYKLNGQVYMVQKAIYGSGRLMCKELDSVEGLFVRVRHMGNGKLTAEMRLDKEQAQAELGALGELYGWCTNCGKVLTDSTSKAWGLGPYCRGHLGY